MKKLLATSLLTTALVTAAIALEEGPFTAAQSGGGRALYAANCAGCHGGQLQGAGEAIAQVIQFPITDLLTKKDQSAPIGELSCGVAE